MVCFLKAPQYYHRRHHWHHFCRFFYNMAIIVIIGMDDNFDKTAFDSFCSVPFSMTKSPPVTDSPKDDNWWRDQKLTDHIKMMIVVCQELFRPIFDSTVPMWLVGGGIKIAPSTQRKIDEGEACSKTSLIYSLFRHFFAESIWEEGATLLFRHTKTRGGEEGGK